MCVCAQTAAILTCSRLWFVAKVFSRANRSGRIVRPRGAPADPDRSQSTRTGGAHRSSPEPTPAPIVKFAEIGLGKFFLARNEIFSGGCGDDGPRRRVEQTTSKREREESRGAVRATCVCRIFVVFREKENRDVAEKLDQAKIVKTKTIGNFPHKHKNKTLRENSLNATVVRMIGRHGPACRQNHVPATRRKAPSMR